MSSRGVRKTGRYSRRLNGFLCIDRDRLRFAEYKVRVLEERLRLVLIEKYAPGSEKLSEAQLELLELEPGVSSAEVEAESQRDQLQLPLKAARNHPGRQQLPAELPRTEQVIAWRRWMNSLLSMAKHGSKG